MTNNAIKPDVSDRKYFFMTPHIVLAKCRDAYDFTLWSVIKTIAGESGECILPTNDLAKLCGCSHGKIVSSRAYLITAGLLTGECRRDPGFPQPVWHLQIPDLWPENVAWRAELTGWRAYITAIENTRLAQKSRHLVTAFNEEPSPGDGGGSPGDGGGSPGDGSSGLYEERPSPGDGMPSPGDAIKIVPIEASSVKEKKEELGGQTPKEVWNIALPQLRLQMTKSTYETWMRDTACVDYTANLFTIATTNAYAKDWLTLRLRPIIRRTLTAITGNPVDVTFTGGDHGT